MEITHEKACHCALNRIFGFEPKIALALISHLGTASAAFDLTSEEVEAILGPYSKYKGKIRRQAIEEAFRELEQLQKKGIGFIGWNENGYPPLLKECEDAPAGLYIRSTSSPEAIWGSRRTIAIVGTRDISPYGKEWCERLVRQFSDIPPRDMPIIVSGLALGTDICAHKTALECGLPTIAVMATGPEDIYPTRHRTIADRIADTPGSALITDYPPGTAPLAIHFLRRNRIIAGLSEATVLIESKIKGGGMMTARLAGSYNRDVFALPGRIDDLRSQGCNLLINNRTASPITSLEGFMKEVGISTVTSQRKESETERLTRLYKGNLPDDKISQMSRILLLIRKEKGITIDEIATRLDTEYRKITQLTGILETDGIISIDLMQRCFINFRQSL